MCRAVNHCATILGRKKKKGGRGWDLTSEIKLLKPDCDSEIVV